MSCHYCCLRQTLEPPLVCRTHARSSNLKDSEGALEGNMDKGQPAVGAEACLSVSTCKGFIRYAAGSHRIVGALLLHRYIHGGSLGFRKASWWPSCSWLCFISSEEGEGGRRCVKEELKISA